MIVMFILVGGLVIKCIGGTWCEPINPRIFNDLISIGGVELLFEMSGFLQIFRGKEDIKYGKDNKKDRKRDYHIQRR